MRHDESVEEPSEREAEVLDLAGSHLSQPPYRGLSIPMVTRSVSSSPRRRPPRGKRLLPARQLGGPGFDSQMETVHEVNTKGYDCRSDREPRVAESLTHHQEEIG